MNFLTGKIVQAICWTLLHSLWQGLLLAVVTGVVMVLSKKAGSALRYKLLSAIFVLFLVVTGFTFYKEMQASNVVADANIVLSPNNLPAVVNNNNVALVTSTNTWQGYVTRFTEYFNTHASLIVTIWFIIFMAQCVKILSGLVYIQRIRHYKTSAAPEFWVTRTEQLAKRLHIKRHIQLLQSAIVKVPVVVGFLKPAILIRIGLLNNMPQEEVESILMHELAHIRRKDYFFNLLQCFVDVVFFFNPAVLWISSLIRNERENCCDDIAISETKSKKQFVQALVSFHQYNAAVSKYAMPFAARKNKLVNRVKRIVNNNNHTLNPKEKIVLVGCLIAFSVAFITVSNGQTATTKKPADKSNTQQPAQNKTNNTPQKQVATPVKPNTKTAAAAKGNANGVNENGVSEDESTPGILTYNEELQTVGYKNISVDKLIELKNHGVTAAFVKSLYALGYKNISADKAEQLVDHGVRAEFIGSLAGMGYKNLSLDQAIELVDHGVNVEFIKELQQAGYNNVPLDKVSELRSHGVTVPFITAMRSLVGGNLTLDEAQELTDHGITPEFVTGWRQAGFAGITVDKAVELRDHGVSIEFVNSFKKLGFTNITPDKATELRDHGVDANFIEGLKKKTGNTFTLDEYIRLKDEGFDVK